MMKRLLPVMLVVALVLAGGGCGGGSVGTSRTERASATGTAGAGDSTASPASRASSSKLMGDADDDDTADNRASDTKKDADGDFDNGRDTEKEGYADPDDKIVSDYGHRASAKDARAIAKLVKSYYAAAASDDGAKACALIYPTFAAAIPEDYGQAPGPAYLRGNHTCQAVMSLVFRHSQAEAGATYTVTGVRVEGSQAYALLGSTTIPAGYISLKRDTGAWRVDTTLAGPLP